MGLTDLVGEPAIHLRMSPGWAIKQSDCGRFLAAASNAFGEFRLTTWAGAFEPANQSLATGAPLAHLRKLVLTAGNDYQAATYLAQMKRLCRMGVLEFPLVEDGEELAIIMPQQDSFVPLLAPRPPAADFVFHHLACIRREGDGWLAESPFSGARFRMTDPAALNRPLVRRALYTADFLEPAQPEPDARGYALAHWEFHDLVFHTHSRRGWHRDPSGAHCPMIGVTEPAPVRRPQWPGIPIALARAPEAGKEAFATVLERRRSNRDFDEDQPITITKLGALLDRAARSRSSGVNSLVGFFGESARFEVAERPSPSAGATHELEIYPVIRHCDGLDPGMYHYDSWRHALVRIPADDADLERMTGQAKLAMATAGTPQVVLAIAARFPRVFWKYKAIGYGNILRNTGALYQTLYLAATELGLAACAIGSADSRLFARVTGLDPFVEGTVGDFVVGSKPRGG